MNDKYFATLTGDELAAELYTRVENYYDDIDKMGRMALWSRCYQAYYSLDARGQHEGAGIRRGGEQNALHLLKANHFRNLLQHLYVLVTQQKPAFECRAINSDYKSQIQTILGTNIIEYYLREKRLAEHFKRAVEYMIVYSEGFIEIGWDNEQGEDVAVDVSGKILKTGDVAPRVYAPIDVIRQYRADADTKLNWYILRRYENRYDLAARYPEQADKIMDYSDSNTGRRFLNIIENVYSEEDDLVPVFKFYHEKTPACPNGREVLFLGADCILEESDLQSDKMHVYRMAAYNQDGTSFGYSVSFDLLCVQEAIDVMYSTIFSNQATFGVQNIWIKPGSNIATQQLEGNLNIIESEEEPKALNLTYTPPEIFNFLKGLENLGEVLSGVNSVARGQPEASLKSGAALALVASQAVQFSNGIQSSYAQCLEDVASALINLLKQRAAIPRTAFISGKDNRSYIKEFTSDDLVGISRVIVDLGNPVARTVAGRIELANNLLQAQQFKSPEQYIQVVTTGRIEPVISNEQVENLLMQSENEQMRQGKPVPVIAIDMHVQHVKFHSQLLADPAARQDPALTQLVLDHMNQHIQALQTTNPALLNMLGQAPMGALPPQAGGQMEQAANGVAPQEGPQPVQAPPGVTPEVAQSMPALPPGAPQPQ
jgi:hypothetical protein